VTDWHPEQELAVLLDAFAEEILTMSDCDIAVGPRGQWEAVKEAAREMRRFVAAAECGLNAPPALGSVERSHSAQKHVN
jgi:hypothetical protein